MPWPCQGGAWGTAPMQAPAYRSLQMLSMQKLMLRPRGNRNRRMPQQAACTTRQHMHRPCRSSLRRQGSGRVEAWVAQAPQVSALRPHRAGLHSSPAAAKSKV